MIHGGDIYNNKVELDFSVNTNPLGIPDSVLEALHQAVERCQCYPDITAGELIDHIAVRDQVEPEQIICGNGASELFLAIVHARKPQKILIPVPSFYGYEKAAKAAKAELCYWKMKREDGFTLTEGILEDMTEDVDLLLLANPNNPTGQLIEPGLLEQILKQAEKNHITVVLDECFWEFTGENHVPLDTWLKKYSNLILVRAFTKIYGIPGVRLGYLLSGNRALCKDIMGHLPEWNLSVFAQQAGVAACKERKFVEKTAVYTAKQREFLRTQLQKYGIWVLNSSADYLLFYSEIPLYDKLLERGILIRDCSNYRGLGRNYYRIAVKSEAENQIFIQVLQKILAES